MSPSADATSAEISAGDPSASTCPDGSAMVHPGCHGSDNPPPKQHEEDTAQGSGQGGSQGEEAHPSTIGEVPAARWGRL